MLRDPEITRGQEEAQEQEEVVVRIPEAGDALLTVAELSELLDVPEGTLHEWAAIGKGPALYGWAKMPFYRMEEVVLWLHDQPGRTVLLDGKKVLR